MKQITIIASLILCAMLTGCTGVSGVQSDMPIDDGSNILEQVETYTETEACSETPALTELEKYVFEVAEYKELDYDYADAYFAEHNDNWGGGCSSISKMVDGHRLVGRNMDLNISNKCAYIVRTDAGEYRTLGLAYTFRDISPDYGVLKENGISEEFYKVLPFMCDDVLNEEGLHVEINMRHGEYWPNGEDKFGCPGTNPDSAQRVYLFELPRYIAENCSSVEEAKKYVASLDVYSQENYWNYCFLVSDAQGNSSLLEFSCNEINWLDEADIMECDWLEGYQVQAIGQTNFYLNEKAWIMQDIKSGEGRFITLQNGINGVNSRIDMYNLMKQVSYSHFYLNYDECKNNYFDPRSEYIGEISWAEYDLIMSDEFEDTAREIVNELFADVRTMSREEMQDANNYWESTFTEVVDTDARQIFVRMFENEDILYLISFDGTEKLASIEDWK